MKTKLNRYLNEGTSKNSIKKVIDNIEDLMSIFEEHKEANFDPRFEAQFKKLDKYYEMFKSSLYSMDKLM